MNVPVSVIMPLYNEERFIENCIASLSQQTYPAELTQWVFADGNSRDRTVELLRSACGNRDYILIDNPDRLAAFGLNKAIGVCTGRYIIRMDAHAKYAPDYIEACVRVLEETGADNVGGLATTESHGYIGGAISEVLSSKFGVGGSSFRTGGEDGEVDTVPFGAFRREVFEKVGLFDTRLVRSEDNDINARIRASGGRVWLSSAIRFTYYCRDTVPALLKMAMQNGNALFFTLKINPSAMSLRHFIPFCFFASLIGLPILSAFFGFFWYVLLAELVLYTLLNIYFSFIKGSLKYAPAALLIYPLFHTFYGLGSALGLLGIKLY